MCYTVSETKQNVGQKLHNFSIWRVFGAPTEGGPIDKISDAKKLISRPSFSTVYMTME